MELEGSSTPPMDKVLDSQGTEFYKVAGDAPKICHPIIIGLQELSRQDLWEDSESLQDRWSFSFPLRQLTRLSNSL